MLGIGLAGQQQQRTAAIATALPDRSPPAAPSSPLLLPRPTAPFRSAISMLADTAFSFKHKLEKWGVFMLAARARAVSAATAAAAGGGRRRRRREAAEAAAAVKSLSDNGNRDRRVSVAAADSDCYSTLAATVVDAEAVLYSRIYVSMLLSSEAEEEEKKKKKRR